MAKTYNSKLERKVSKSVQTAKKGSLQWYKEKYGDKKGEVQYHIDKALEAQMKLKPKTTSNKNTTTKKPTRKRRVVKNVNRKNKK